MDYLGPLQVRIMQHVWRNGPSTVHDVHDALNALPGSKQLAYTTILTVMRSLAKRHLLNQEPVGRFHRFSPLVEQDVFNKVMVVKLCDELFEGKDAELVACLERSRKDPPPEL